MVVSCCVVSFRHKMMMKETETKMVQRKFVSYLVQMGSFAKSPIPYLTLPSLYFSCPSSCLKYPCRPPQPTFISCYSVIQDGFPKQNALRLFELRTTPISSLDTWQIWDMVQKIIALLIRHGSNIIEAKAAKD